VREQVVLILRSTWRIMTHTIFSVKSVACCLLCRPEPMSWMCSWY
jgi:hypothetical protein